jgi:rhamnose utilization protein RhaD (predicted bifunctional aldolase and dehydrogenase)
VNLETTPLADAVRAFCARIGADPLLVQDAGGNVSWKDDGVLWVKASGTRMADALARQVFVPVDLGQACTQSHPAVLAATGEGAPLRPSIETMLHALMPQRVVAHLHAIEALAHLVRADDVASLASALGDLRHAWVPYCQPGLALACGVAQALRAHPGVDTLLLANHGVVIGGDDVDDVQCKLDRLLARLRHEPRALPAVDAASAAPAGWALPCDAALHALALDLPLLARVRRDWAICPDHVVFLGPDAPLFDSTGALAAACATSPAAIVPGVGVFVADGDAQRRATAETMLRCYVEILRRVPEAAAVRTLPDVEIGALVYWEAEAYRRAMKH